MPNSRRDFLGAALAAVAGGGLLMPGSARAAGAALTIRQVIDLINGKVAGAPFPKTVDTIKAGNADQPVKGIVTTMFATDAIIEKAAAMGANFIIAHEPTFYNHLDETDWLAGDKVYSYKKALLDKHGIVVWRFHDGIHSLTPDGVRLGVLQAMGWDKYFDPGSPELIKVPAMSFREIIGNAKNKLGIEQVRVIGDLSTSCQRILLVPGAAGGRAQIGGLRQHEPDLLIIGELSEWETAEYVRDARAQGMRTCLLVLGHAVSEEPGMVWMAPWLRKLVPGVKVEHISSGNPLTFV